jgi:hypothetical protein
MSPPRALGIIGPHRFGWLMLQLRHHCAALWIFSTDFFQIP